MPDQPPGIDSFVIRFVRPGSTASPQDPGPMYRGVIRHVQSNKTRAFTHWKEAEAFISRYVHLENPDPPPEKPPEPEKK